MVKTRKRKQNGGGVGAAYEFKNPSYGSLVQNPFAIASASSCGGADRPMIVASKGALPGMGGGSRKKSQRGGRYATTFDPLGMGAPWASAIPSIKAIPCDGSSTPIPDHAAVLNRVGGPLWVGAQKGGNKRGGNFNPNQPVIDQGFEQAGGSGSGSESVQVSAENPNAYSVPTAGYTQLVNPAGIISTGAGTLLPEIVPTHARVGGSRKVKKNRSKKNKNTRKSKKSRR